MPRVFTDPYLAAIQAQVVRPALFFYGMFTSGPLYVWSGLGSINWNGQTWLGVGSLGTVSTIEEGADVQARGITVSLSGIDPTLLTAVLGEFQPGLPVTLWLGLFDETGALIPSPVISFAGRLDQPSIQVSSDTATISINCESRLLDLNTPVDRRYTNEDQQIDYPGDRGFEFVNGIQEVTIYWGRTPSSTNNR